MNTFFYSIILGSVLLAGDFSSVYAQNTPNFPETPALDTVKTAFPDGSLSRIYTVRKGTNIREGVSISYHPNGKVAVEAPYANGVLNGVLRTYFENGNLWQTIGYKDGDEEGVSVTYFENGKKKKKETFKDGVLFGAVEEYSTEGKLLRRIPYENGQVHGLAKVFDEKGAVAEEMTFDRGLRHGPYRRYKKGIKILEAKFERNRCVENCDF